MPQPKRPKRRWDAQPQIVSDQRRRQLGSSFAEVSRDQAWDYDDVRPGYPQQAIGEILAGPHQPGGAPTVVDLGAGTGILTRQLLERGADVIAVEPSLPMVLTTREREHRARGLHRPEDQSLETEFPRTANRGSLRVLLAGAEHTGLPEGCADVVVAATAWHWFEPEPVQSEILRLLKPQGVLSVISNHLDNTQDWVLRMARIMRAGDNYRPGWTLRLGPGFTAATSTEYRWTRKMTVEELMRLNTTLSSWLSASEQDRQRRRTNLSWYLHEHLGHQPGETVEVPYITSSHTAYRR